MIALKIDPIEKIFDPILCDMLLCEMTYDKMNIMFYNIVCDMW